MAKKYCKKPVVIDAVQWTGDNDKEIEEFCGFDPSYVKLTYDPMNNCLIIPTLEGNMKASVGDYIIRGVHGEYYPCKPDIFMETYQAVDD